MVGLASTHQIPASLALGRFWQLRDLFTDPAARRQGVGRRLVELVKEHAKEAGALRLSLQTEPDNAAALALYRDCGFQITADFATLVLDLG